MSKKIVSVLFTCALFAFNGCSFNHQDPLRDSRDNQASALSSDKIQALSEKYNVSKTVIRQAADKWYYNSELRKQILKAKKESSKHVSKNDTQKYSAQIQKLADFYHVSCAKVQAAWEKTDAKFSSTVSGGVDNYFHHNNTD